MLQPASPDLGGPSLNTPVQSGLTDAKGGVIFTALGQWIWRVTFTGTYAGQPLQAVSAQGRPPYGTTTGDGWVVQVQAQEEHVTDDAAGQPSTPPLERAGFVLLAHEAAWIPAIDLSLPTDPPRPLAAPPMTTPDPSQPTSSRPADPPRDSAESGLDPFGLSFWVLPLLAAGVALWQAGQRRRAIAAETTREGRAVTPAEGAPDDST